MSTVQAIDVLWVKGRSIIRAFEVDTRRRFTPASSEWQTARLAAEPEHKPPYRGAHREKAESFLAK